MLRGIVKFGVLQCGFYSVVLCRVALCSVVL